MNGQIHKPLLTAHTGAFVPWASSSGVVKHSESSYPLAAVEARVKILLLWLETVHRSVHSQGLPGTFA